jgi:hypothetical protein
MGKARTVNKGPSIPSRRRHNEEQKERKILRKTAFISKDRKMLKPTLSCYTFSKN